MEKLKAWAIIETKNQHRFPIPLIERREKKIVYRPSAIFALEEDANKALKKGKRFKKNKDKELKIVSVEIKMLE